MTSLPRSGELEILDHGRIDGVPVPREVLARSLAHVEAVDRWLGGARALRSTLERRLPPEGRVRILDVGTGNGRLLRRVVAAVARPRRSCIGVGVEIDAASLAIAGFESTASPTPPGPPALVRADGLRLPLADASVDVAMCVLTLHHFAADDAVSLLREMGRVARRAVLVSDLRRSVPAWWGARLLASTVWRHNPVTRHDGPLSVRRAFTAGELEALGRAAGLSAVTVRRVPLFRLMLEGAP